MTKITDIRDEKIKQKIKQLNATIADLTEVLHNARVESSEIQAELDVCTGMNDRLNRTIKKEREAIETLKGVARFFRAQRDRIDAYLSGTLDGVERERDARYPKDTYDANQVAVDVSPGVQDRRPNVQEPDAGHGYDGRCFEAYRDHEPQQKDWESL